MRNLFGRFRATERRAVNEAWCSRDWVVSTRLVSRCEAAPNVDPTQPCFVICLARRSASGPRADLQSDLAAQLWIVPRPMTFCVSANNFVVIAAARRHALRRDELKR